MVYQCIVAIDALGGIAKFDSLKNDYVIPFNSKIDREYFRNATANSVVIMGYKTYKPILSLPNRKIVCVARNENWNKTNNADRCDTLQLALNLCAEKYPNKEIFVCGGVNLYNMAIMDMQCVGFLVNQFHENYNCELKIDLRKLLQNWFCIANAKVGEFQSLTFARIKCEKEYLNLIDNIINFGDLMENRTTIPTLSLTAQQLRYQVICEENKYLIPLLTTKRVNFKNILTELFWFMSGDTNSKTLESSGNNIWRDNTTREFLDNRNLLHYEVGEIGPSYGYQWRANTDQLSQCVKLLFNEHYSRRIIVNCWQVDRLHEMVLPPCHYAFQFVARRNLQFGDKMQNKYIVDIVVNMRSADMGLGVPYNLVSYTILLILIANMVYMTPGEVVLNMANCHVYINHVNQLKKQLLRTPRTFPTLTLPESYYKILCNDENKTISMQLNEISLLKCDDFVISGYQPDSYLQMDMAI